MNIMNVILLYLAILPSLLLGFYIYKKDKVDKEPLQLLLRSSIGGIIAALFVIIFSIMLKVNSISLDTQYGIFLYSFFGVALLEEGFKYLITYLICYKNKDFNYYYDGIIYASFVSLGFATFENCLYIYNLQDIIVAISRGLLTVPSHVFYAIFMGYYMANAKHYRRHKKKKDEKLHLLKAILMPFVLHGFFDYCLFSKSNTMTLFFIIFVLILYIASFKKVDEVSSNDKHI